MTQRIGIVGGTFDPIHIGHLILAVHVRDALKLDTVLLIPNYQSPLKAAAPVADFQDRLAMVRLAIDGVNGLDASDIDGRRGGTSYMIDTVRALTDTHANAEFFLIMGADALRDLPLWRDAKSLQNLVTIAAVMRGDQAVGADEFGAVHVAMPRLDVSASEIRRRLREGCSVEFMTTAGVIKYIRDHQLYGVRA